MKMSDFFNLPMDVGSSSNDNNVGTACTELADNDFYLADFHRENTLEEAHSMAKAAACAINQHDALVAMNAELVANLEYFVHRVDAGTARSTTTYNKFKATLAKAKELSQ